MWRTGFGIGCRHAVRMTTEWMNDRKWYGDASFAANIFWVTVTARNWKLFVRKAKMFGCRIVGLLLQLASSRGKSGIWDLHWTKQRTYNVTLRRVCATFVAVENIGIKYSELVFVALGIQHAKRMRRVILLSLTSPNLQHFSTLSYKRHDFRKKATEHKMCAFDFVINFVWNISHSKRN